MLVVEDGPRLLPALRTNLRAWGMTVVTAETGAQAPARAADSNPDLIILDLGLPDLDGPNGFLRQGEALDACADDYMTKPIAMHEFFARVCATLRHGPRPLRPATRWSRPPGPPLTSASRR